MRWSIILPIALGLAGCTKDREPQREGLPAAAPDTTHDSDEPATAPGERPTESDASRSSRAAPVVLEVLERGEKPRRSLGWSAEAGAAHKLKIRVDTELEANLTIMVAQQTPASMVFDLTVRMDEQALDQRRVVSFTIDQARFVHGDGIAPKLRKERDEGVATLVGLEGSYPIDSFGTLDEVALNLSPDAPLVAQRIGRDLRWAVRQLAAPFPTDRIGAGATWTVKHRMDQDGFDTDEVSRLKVTKLSDQAVTLRRDIQQSAEPQTVRNPRSKMHIELREFEAEGSSEIVWDLTKPAPRSAKISVTENKRLQWELDKERAGATSLARRTVTVKPPNH